MAQPLWVFKPVARPLLVFLKMKRLDFQPMESPSSTLAGEDKLDNSIIESATREHVFTDFVDSRWRQADTEAKTFEMERIKQLQGKHNTFVRGRTKIMNRSGNPLCEGVLEAVQSLFRQTLPLAANGRGVDYSSLTLRSHKNNN